MKRTLVLFAVLALAVAGCSDDNGKVPTFDSLVPDGAADSGTTEGGTDGLSPDGSAAHKAISFKVVHMNDTHSGLEASSQTLELEIGGNKEQTGVQIGGYPRLIAKIAELRQKGGNMLTLHAGDALQGTLYFVKHGEKADLEMLNLMKLDAFVLGNHEFDKGPQLAADFINGAQFPVLGANIDASKEPLLKDKIKAYEIKEVDGEKVAILGLDTPLTSEIASPGSTVTFGDPIAKAKEMVQEIEGKGVNKVILLSHLGYDEDLKLAAAVDGIDVIVGGHTHTLLGTSKDFEAVGMTVDDAYPTMAKSRAGKDVCVVTAWYAARALGLLDIELDRDGFVTKCGGNMLLPVGDTFTQFDPVQKKVVEVDATKKAAIETIIKASPILEVVQEDASAVSKRQTYKQAVDALMKEEVPGVDVVDDLWHARVPGYVHPTAGKMNKGSYIAPHVAEGYLHAANTLGQSAEIAVTNAGGVRCDVEKGKLSVGKVFELQPFFNTLYVIKLTGKDLKDQLETVAPDAAEDSSKTGRFPYLAGARYTLDMTKATGQRITTLEVKGAGGSWAAIDNAKEYVIVTNAFMAGGGDGYTIFKSATYRKDLASTVDSDVFIEYAKHVKQLKQPTETSVTFIPKP
jgi:5'-nucleotidase